MNSESLRFITCFADVDTHYLVWICFLLEHVDDIQFIITSDSLYIFHDWSVSVRILQCQSMTLVFLCPSSIWGCPFCRTKGQGRRIVAVFIVLEVVICSDCCSILFSRWWWSWEEEQSSGLQWFFNWRMKYWEHAFRWNGFERACFIQAPPNLKCISFL